MVGICDVYEHLVVIQREYFFFSISFCCMCMYALHSTQRGLLATQRRPWEGFLASVELPLLRRDATIQTIYSMQTDSHQ